MATSHRLNEEIDAVERSHGRKATIPDHWPPGLLRGQVGDGPLVFDVAAARTAWENGYAVLAGAYVPHIAMASGSIGS